MSYAACIGTIGRATAYLQCLTRSLELRISKIHHQYFLAQFFDLERPYVKTRFKGRLRILSLLETNIRRATASLTGINMDKQTKPKPAKSVWNYHPKLPIGHAPVFVWPPKPKAALVEILKRWVVISSTTMAAVSAAVYYNFLLPDAETLKTLSFGWIGAMFATNLAFFIAFAGLLHLYLYRFSAQGQKFKFDARPLAKNNRLFTFADQVRDNMFWSLVSGVTIWTGYEVLYFWGQANGVIRSVTFSEAPVLIVVVLLLLPFFNSMHFYWIHRMLHWPPLYRSVHHVHHRSINIGPWSGISMHPVETAIFMSSVLIHFVIPTHPAIVLFHLASRVIGPTLSHCGFETILLKDSKVMSAGHFHHQLHHRYYECNYGTPEMPWDEWFGSFHDGSEEATDRVRKTRKRKHAA